MIDPDTGLYVRNCEVRCVVWQGIEIEISYERDFLNLGRSHVEVRSINPPKAPLPVTTTGYRSDFPMAADVEAYGDVVAYVIAGLEEKAKGKEWQAHVAASRQLSLF